MARDDYPKRTILLVLIIIFGVLSFLVARPFILTIITSMILAYMLNPAYKKLKQFMKNANLSAAIISFIIFLAIFLPIWFLTPVLVRQTFSIYTTIQNVDFVAPLIKIAPSFFASPEFTRDFTVTINSLVIKIVDSVMSRFESLITDLPWIVTQLVILFFVFFFALRDEEKIVRFLRELSPFNEETEKKFTKQFNNITKSVIYGMLIVGIIQGIAAGFGFYAFGVSHALLLTLIAILMGILPVLGPFMLWLPIGIGMILSGKISMAILFLTYNIITTIIVNFFIGPKIIEKRAQMPQVIALIGMLGGGYVFGVIGLIIGPLIIGYFLILIEFYRNKKLNELFGIFK